jgi:hypothetical protein
MCDLNCDGVEMLWIEVLIPNFKLLVCVVYRPPGTTESSSKWLSVTQIIDDSKTMSSKYDNLFRTLRAFK